MKHLEALATVILHTSIFHKCNNERKVKSKIFLVFNFFKKKI